MLTPQPLTLAGIFILSAYAASCGVAYGLARILLVDRRGQRCGQAH